jgi:hypothetical protein
LPWGILTGAICSRAEVVIGLPVALPAPVNTAGRDEHPRGISDDGLTLYFGSSRSNSASFYTATRASVDAPWQEPVPITGIRGCCNPTVTPDELTLLFDAWSPVLGWNGLWMATRPDTNAPWSTPELLPFPINRVGDTSGAAYISPDRLTILFSSFTRAGGQGDDDIWLATRPTAVDEWTVENLGPPVNTPHVERAPYLSKDQLHLFFGSERPGGHGSFDLYVSNRANATDPWGTPVHLGRHINTPLNENIPLYWDEGQTLFFRTQSLGDLGNDIAMSHVYSLTDLSGDFNGDNRVDAADYVLWRRLNGTVLNQDRYSSWRANFGNSAVAAVASSANRVPEPGSLFLGLCAVALLAAMRNTRQRLDSFAFHRLAANPRAG